MSRCTEPKDRARIRRNQLRSFERRRGKALRRKTRETLFQFAELIEHSSSDSTVSEDEQVSTNENEMMADIQHSLTRSSVTIDQGGPTKVKHEDENF